MAEEQWKAGRASWERIIARLRGRAAGNVFDDNALDALSDVGTIRRVLDQAELEAVRAARRGGKSWAEIATRLGVTRQTAWERWRELDAEIAGAHPGAETAEPTGVAREQAAPAGRARHAERRAAEYTGMPGMVKVPDVVGMSWRAAALRLEEERLQAVNGTPHIDTEVAEAQVVEQFPRAGELVAAYGSVTLSLGRGPGSAGVGAPLAPPPTPRARRGMLDETTGQSVP